MSMLVEIGSAGAVTKVASNCSTQKDFEDMYGHQAFQILSQAANPQELLKQKTRRSFIKTNINTQFIKEVLVEVFNPLDDSEVNQIESEINVLKDVESLKIAPKFYACTFEIINKGEESAYFYYIIQENLIDNMLEPYVLGILLDREPIGQILIFLRIAFVIQTLHAKGYVHQDIRPENIMSTNDNISEVRLIDFSKAVKVGERGLEGTKYYYSPDKFKENFNASYHHDAYAFALTILFMYDFDYSFQTEMSSKYPSDLKAFPEDCKKLFTDKISKLKNEKYLSSDILKYIEPHLFDKNNPLDISDMNTELIKIYRTLVVGEGKKYILYTKLVDFFEKSNQEKLVAINSIKNASKKNILII